MWIAASTAALAAAVPASSSARTVRVDAGSSPPAATVDGAYVSFGVDVDSVVGALFWNPSGASAPSQTDYPEYDFSRPTLNRLTRALVAGGPAYLRISGTGANKFFYDGSATPRTQPPAGYKSVLTRAEWDRVGRFAQQQGLKLFLGVNAGPGPRDAGYRWLPENTRELLAHTKRRGYPLAVVEYGNEPNLFAGTSGAPLTYTAKDYARDSKIFKAMLRALAPGARLIGPGPFIGENGDLEKPLTVNGVPRALGPEMRDILPALPKRFYDIVNYHFYPAYSTRCVFTPHVPPTTAGLLSSAWLGKATDGLSYVTGLRNAHAAGRPIWLTETGSASCGGQSGYSDRHLSTFFTLNQLGQLAKRGVGVVVRQTLSGGNYGLLSSASGRIDDGQGAVRPNPDYWAALLWRRLMGPRQLGVRTAGAAGPVKIFGSCTAGRKGTQTLLALNPSPGAAAAVQLAGRGAATADVYRVTAPALTSREVKLNGRTLRAPGGNVPALRPVKAASGRVALPPASYAFIVQNAGGRTCG
jgi:heparanase